MVRNIFVTGLLLLGSTFASAHNEVQLDNNEKEHNKLRSLLLRGSVEANPEQEEEGQVERELKPPSDYGARLKLYQMDTTKRTDGWWSQKEASDEGFSFGTQPFYKPLSNGASGEMIYRP
jgi:hypothetical protein